MELCFGKTSRKVAAQNAVEQLWSTIVCEIPGLAPHRDGLKMQYIDDEGDNILVTTNDELQEALQVGKETSNGFLSLNLSVTGMTESSRTAIEDTVSPFTDDESTEDEDEDEAVPSPPPRCRVVNSTEPDILQVLKDAGVSAISEINSALSSASSEIDKMFMQLGTASAKQKKTEAQLAEAKAELAEVNIACAEGEQQVVLLTKKLEDCNKELAESESQKERDAARLQDLESQVSEAAEWENKFKVAEKERLKLDQQLKTLRSALQSLTMAEPEPEPTPATTKTTPTPTPTPVTAEVVSNEIVPELVIVPALPPIETELPPPYEEPAAKPLFPKNCPAPSPLELQKQQQLQQLRDMGFNLTLEQLNEKLDECSGNMDQVVHSLLCM